MKPASCARCADMILKTSASDTRRIAPHLRILLFL
jgi:hypothetical protein